MLGKRIYQAGEEEELIDASKSHPVNWDYLVSKNVVSAVPSDKKTSKKETIPYVESPAPNFEPLAPTPPTPKKVSVKNKPSSN